MKTDFGFEKIEAKEKAGKVSGVFSEVAQNYDLMNDLMSLFMHRLWKQKTVNLAGITRTTRALDLASGTADIALLIAKKIVKLGGYPEQITISDINPAMLEIGINKLLKKGFNVAHKIANIEELSFVDNSFELVTIGFGLRNVTDKSQALKEIFRVLAPEGKLLILEFSQINKNFQKIYDFYSFKCIPFLGKLVSGSSENYQYLVESIRMHPNQEQLKVIIESAGFRDVNYINLALGGVAIHIATK